MKKILVLLLALILSLSLLCSCNKDGDGDPTDDEANGSQNATEETIDGILLSGEDRYRVVYPHGDSALKAISLKIYDKLLELDPIAPTKPAYYSLISDKTDPAGAKEILIGLTNRPATEKAADALQSYPDFTITLQDGNIAIFANTQARLDAAVRYFVKNMKVSAGGDVYYTGGENYVDVYKGDYPSATINGNPLKDYKIVLAADASDAQKTLATELSNTLSFISGTSLPTVTDDSEKFRIVFGKGDEGALNDKIYLDGDALVLAPASENGYQRLIETLASKIRACRGIVTDENIKFSSLSYDAIKSISFGAVNISEQPDGLRFNKFSQKQIEEWTKFNRYNEASGSTGIRLDFYTDSSSFFFRGTSGKKFELFVNGESVNISSDGYIEAELDNTQENRVTLLFPNHQVNATLYELRLDEGASIRPYEYSRKFLIVGDSITQGYSSVTDSLSWANRITRMFDADSVIQAISGGTFRYSTLDPDVEFTPDYIFVAYGTNDWSGGSSMESFKANAQAYYDKLAELYPNATIIGITPIWRKDNHARNVGEFDDMCAELKTIIESVGGYAVNGVDLVPHDRKYYGEDICLHPNDEGFEFYANNLYEAVKDIIK